ncbi:MAG: outer membrane beta-barrel protein [Bacteroidales bacterium]|nr:outer membrane beta-barrel protein [Bacteroidales bacterium]
MKKFIIILFLGVISLSLFAQKNKDNVLNYQGVDQKKLHFGFTLGLNTMDFKITPSMNEYGADSKLLYPELNDLLTGFHVGIVSNLRLTEFLDLRFLPGISLGTRKILFYDENHNLDREMKIESTFIDLPLLLKYKATRINNTRPYIIGGVNVRNDMARNKEFIEEEKAAVYIKMKSFDIYYDLGAGVDFYLTYLKFSFEIKYSVGMLNVVSSDSYDDDPQYANSIDKLNSRIFMVSLHFE